MTWPQFQLGEITSKIGSGSTPKGGQEAYQTEGVPLIRSMNVHDRRFLDKGIAFLDQKQAKQLDVATLRKGDVLLNITGASVGRVCCLPDNYAGGRVNQHVVIIRPIPERLNPSYLQHYLTASSTKANLLRIAGAGATREAITKSAIEQLEIPLPPIQEQTRIAAILDQADELPFKRRRTVDRINQLGQAIFHEMFGDPVANPKGFPVQKLGEIGMLDRGISKHRPRNDPALLGGSHPLIQTGDVANADGYVRSFSSTYSDLGLKQSRKWPKGTLCITIAANIGKTAILEIDACFPDSVVGFTPGSDTNAEYVQFWMERIQKRLEEIAPQSAQKNINLAILRELPIPMPAKPLQDEFREFIHSIEKQKESLRGSQLQGEQLFYSLQHQAFRGEL